MNPSVVTPEDAALSYDPWVTLQVKQGMDTLQGLVGVEIILLVAITLLLLWLLVREQSQDSPKHRGGT